MKIGRFNISWPWKRAVSNHPMVPAPPARPVKRRKYQLSTAWMFGIMGTSVVGLVLVLAITVYFWWLLRTFV